MRNKNKVFKGKRFTKAREKIVRLLPDMKGHFTTQDLFFALKKRNIPIGIATVYRTLNLLSRQAILKRTLKIPKENFMTQIADLSVKTGGFYDTNRRFERKNRRFL